MKKLWRFFFGKIECENCFRFIYGLDCHNEETEYNEETDERKYCPSPFKSWMMRWLLK